MVDYEIRHLDISHPALCGMLKYAATCRPKFENESNSHCTESTLAISLRVKELLQQLFE